MLTFYFIAPGPGNYKIVSTFNETKCYSNLQTKHIKKIEENATHKQ